MYFFNDNILINDMMLFGGAIVALLLISAISKFFVKKETDTDKEIKKINELLKDNK